MPDEHKKLAAKALQLYSSTPPAEKNTFSKKYCKDKKLTWMKELHMETSQNATASLETEEGWCTGPEIMRQNGLCPSDYDEKTCEQVVADLVAEAADFWEIAVMRRDHATNPLLTRFYYKKPNVQLHKKAEDSTRVVMSDHFKGDAANLEQLQATLGGNELKDTAGGGDFEG